MWGKKTILFSGHIYFRVRITGRQGRPSCVAVDLRLRDGRLPGMLGLFLLPTGTPRGRGRLQSRAVDQSRHVHQYVFTRFRSHTGSDDGRAVQSGRQGTSVGHRLRDRVPVRVRRRQNVPKPVGLVRARHHLLDILRFLYIGHAVRVVPGAGDEEQNAARNPKRTERQEKPQKPQHQPQPANGIAYRRKERSNCLTRLARAYDKLGGHFFFLLNIFHFQPLISNKVGN